MMKPAPDSDPGERQNLRCPRARAALIPATPGSPPTKAPGPGSPDTRGLQQVCYALCRSRVRVEVRSQFRNASAWKRWRARTGADPAGRVVVRRARSSREFRHHPHESDRCRGRDLPQRGRSRRRLDLGCSAGDELDGQHRRVGPRGTAHRPGPVDHGQPAVFP